MFRPYDMHMHTDFSTDSEAPMEDMAEAAVRKGLRGIAITDHYHPDYPNPAHRTGQPTPAYHRAMERLAEAYEGRLEVFKGIEMGVLPGETMAQCEAAVRDYHYDFILASFHSNRERTFDDLARDKRVTTEQAFRMYYEHVLLCITLFKDYDVLAHLNLLDRYAPYVPADSLYTAADRALQRVTVLWTANARLLPRFFGTGRGADDLHTASGRVLRQVTVQQVANARLLPRFFGTGRVANRKRYL